MNSTMKLVIRSIFFIVIVISIIILFDSYNDLVTSNKKVLSLLTEISVHITNNPLLQDSTLTPQVKAFVNQLDYSSKGILESNTVVFIFQIFSLVIVSIGGFILSYALKNVETAQKDVNRITKKATTIGPLIKSVTAFSSIISLMLLTRQDSILISKSDIIQSQAQYFDNIRVSLRTLVREISDAAKNKFGCYEDIIESLIGQNQDIKGYILSLPKDVKKKNEDLIRLCNEIENLLMTSNFVENYEKQLAVLSDDN